MLSIAIAFIISYARTIDDTVNGIFFVHGKVYTVCLLGELSTNPFPQHVVCC